MYLTKFIVSRIIRYNHYIYYMNVLKINLKVLLQLCLSYTIYELTIY